ncbi:isomerase [Micromonospora fiedleri]|uniref:Isomerase n=1 Tax=Micromonospora fiedleri TaxID=1157498 RepID=A0ABS1USP4_9ACTN|nr:isomerase [Micromonospora fiedleri]MBL6279390.1 isomerase [Micromonospora fiedleri]
MTSHVYEDTVERYVRFWNTGQSEEQRRLAADTFTEEVSYHALVGVLTGVQALIDFRGQFIQRVGAAVLQRRAAPQIHHDRARLMWEIELDGGQSFAAGTDVLVFDADGRISSVSMFLDRAPEGFDPHAHH